MTSGAPSRKIPRKVVVRDSPSTKSPFHLMASSLYRRDEFTEEEYLDMFAKYTVKHHAVGIEQLLALPDPAQHCALIVEYVSRPFVLAPPNPLTLLQLLYSTSIPSSPGCPLNRLPTRTPPSLRRSHRRGATSDLFRRP